MNGGERPKPACDSIPAEWREDESCEELRRIMLAVKDEARLVEGNHLSYLQFFGESYERSEFAGIVRKLIFDKTGRDVQ